MSFPSLAEIEIHSKEVMQEQVKWARGEFHLSDLDPAFLMVNSRTAPYGQARSLRRGGYRIKLGVFNLLNQTLLGFQEYSSYDNKSDIGGFKTSDWKIWIEAVIAHELSHVVQFMLAKVSHLHPLYEYKHKLSFQGLGYYEDGHGPFFQAIYRRLRCQFINHRIDICDRVSPARSFEPLNDIEERLQTMSQVSIQGMPFTINGKTYKIVGRNPQTTAKLYGFTVQDDTGSFFRIKLITLSADPVVKSAILKDPVLEAELRQNAKAQLRKIEANKKSSHTKARRAAYA